MPVADTELLFLLNPGDSRHKKALARMREFRVLVPDTAWFEFIIVMKSKGVGPSDIRQIVLSAERFLERRGVRTAGTLSPRMLVEASLMEERDGLSFFDSLIAASALALDGAVFSDDPAYERVPRLRRIPIASV